MKVIAPVRTNKLWQVLNAEQIIAHLRTPLYRNGYALILSTGITSVFGLLYWVVAAQFYSTEAVGLNSAVISIMIFLSSIAQVNLQETMIRYIPEAGRKTVRFVVYAYGTVIAISAVVGVIFCLGISIWSPSLSLITSSPMMAFWFIVAIALWGIFVLQDSILAGLRQALWIPFENAIFSVIKIGLLILMALLSPDTGIFVSWTLSVLLIILPINALLFRRLIPRHATQESHREAAVIPVPQIVKYVASNYIAAILANVATTLLPLIITQVEGAEANAHFYLAWTLASSLQIIVANMATSLTVEATIHKDDQDEYRRRAMIGIIRLLLPLTAIVTIAAPLMLRLMGESYVEEGVPLLRLLALSAIPNIYNAVYVSLARAQNRVRGIIGVYTANALLVLGLSHLFLPEYGIVGVGIAWVISQSAIAFTLMVSSRFHSTKPNLSPAI